LNLLELHPKAKRTVIKNGKWIVIFYFEKVAVFSEKNPKRL